MSDGAKITSTEFNGDTGLHLSAERGHKDVMLTFITNKVDVNIRGYGQWTALINAAIKGHLSCPASMWAASRTLLLSSYSMEQMSKSRKKMEGLLSKVVISCHKLSKVVIS